MDAPVSIIVAARNYGQYLGDCLKSCLGQTVQARDVIYVDDGSEDDSIELARAIPGVHVVACAHEGVVAARNVGAELARGCYYLFVDGDDLLTPDYLQRHVEAMEREPRAGFAYGPAQAFGDHNIFWDAPYWDRTALWRANFVNTSALYRNDVFRQGGRWRETPTGSGWDWDLALRASRLAPGVRSSATLLYRQHAGSWCWTHERYGDNWAIQRGMIRRANVRVAICSVLSGNTERGLNGFFRPWLDAIAASVHPFGRPELFLLNNGSTEFGGVVEREAGRVAELFGRVVISPWPLRYSWSSEEERRDRVSRFMAGACNRLLALSQPGEVVWFVEDDVEVPRDAYRRLLELLTDGDGRRPFAAVTGAYRVRHPGQHQYFVHSLDEKREPPNAIREDFGLLPVPVHLCGTGCLMVFRPEAPHEFPISGRDSRGSEAHDFAWCEIARRRGGLIMLDPRVYCRHWHTAEACV